MIEFFGFKLSYRLIALGYAVIGVVALASAFTAEYVFGLLPCKLCLLQRWPYLWMIVAGLIAVILGKNRTLYLLCLVAILGAFSYGGYIAVYQVGGEQGWWQLTADCASALDANLTPEEYIQALQNMPSVPCDVVAWSLFGISMAGYNALFSIFMAVITLFITVKVALTKQLDLLV